MSREEVEMMEDFAVKADDPRWTFSRESSSWPVAVQEWACGARHNLLVLVLWTVALELLHGSTKKLSVESELELDGAELIQEDEDDCWRIPIQLCWCCA